MTGVVYGLIVWALAGTASAQTAVAVQAGRGAAIVGAPAAGTTLDLSAFRSPNNGELSLTPALAEDALSRVLARSPELSVSWSAAAAASRPALLAAALSVQAQDLERRLQAAPAAPGSAGAVIAAHALSRQALDALLLLETQAMPPDDARILRDRFTAARAEADSRFAAESARLLGANMERVEREARILGRTRLLDLDDGAVLAVKSQNSPAHEAAMMSRAELFGVTAPIPLPAGQDRVLHYLVPRELAGGYFSYLGQRLSLPKSERKPRVREAALKVIDQLAVLQRHGHRHFSLAALSHSGGTWEWNYWRMSNSYFSLLRFGPTSLHNWRSGLRFPNMRLSGLADYEHVGVLAPEDAFHRVDGLQEREKSLRYRILGQNLTEWSLTVMRAGLNNGLGLRWTAELLAEGLWRWGELMVPGGLPPAADRRVLKKAALSAARRYFTFTRLNAAMPQFLADFINAIVDINILSAVKRGEALVMPGAVVAPLVLDVVRPVAGAAAQEPDWDITLPRSSLMSTAGDWLIMAVRDLSGAYIVAALLTAITSFALALVGVVSFPSLSHYVAGFGLIWFWGALRWVLYAPMRRWQARRAARTWLAPRR